MVVSEINNAVVCARANGNGKHRRNAMSIALLSGASLFVMASFAGAQAQTANNVAAPVAQPAQATTAAADAGIEEVVVSARRRSENAQTVPLVVDAVSNQELQKYHILNLVDVTSVVPGLALKANGNGIGAVATLRGVNYDVNASGNNGTVQFYLNDQPVAGNVVLQAMYDIGQIEVLRGPQGTLRGRAAPSGSITVTTKLPDLEDWGATRTARSTIWVATMSTARSTFRSSRTSSRSALPASTTITRPIA
jgi:iron complex outermembrane receptor protein